MVLMANRTLGDVRVSNSGVDEQSASACRIACPQVPFFSLTTNP